MPASAVLQAQAPGYLGTQFNQNGVMNNVELQATVRDDASQPVPDSVHANLQIAIIRQGDAQNGARLLWGADDSSRRTCLIPGYLAEQQPCVWANTINGVAQFSLSSGPNKGGILLALTADRSDNDVANGIDDPITQLLTIDVVDGVPSGVLAFAGISGWSAKAGDQVAQLLEATGGYPPYEWAKINEPPPGINMHSTGALAGVVPNAPGKSYSFRVQVTDASGEIAVNVVTLAIQQDKQ